MLSAILEDTDRDVSHHLRRKRHLRTAMTAERSLRHEGESDTVSRLIGDARGDELQLADSSPSIDVTPDEEAADPA